MAKLSQTYKSEGGLNTAPVSNTVPTLNSQKLSQIYKSEGGLDLSLVSNEQSTIPKLSQTYTSNSTPSLRDNKEARLDKVRTLAQGASQRKANKIIDEYESLPKTNLISRLLSPASKESYNRKQELNPLYEQAKDAQVKEKLNSLGISDSDIMRKSGSASENRRITELLKSKGITDKETIKAVQNYSERLLANKVGKNLTEYADEHPVIGSALSVPFRMASGISGVAETGAKYLSGEPLTNSRGALSFNKTVNNMRGAVADDMNDVGQFFYNSGMSMADMLANRYVLGNFGAAGMGAQKGTDTISNAVDQGLTPNQIMAKGVSSGVSTWLTEKYLTMKELDKIKEAGFSALGKEGAAKVILKALNAAGLAEGLQEGAEDLVDWAADALISKDKNEFKQLYDSYKAQGLSDTDAIAKVIGDKATELALDAAGGYLSGFVGGGVEVGKSNISNRINNRNNNIPTLEQQTTPVTKTSNTEIPTVNENVTVPTEQNGIRVYRGYNRSDNPLETNLAKQKTIYDILGKNNPYEEDYLPLAYFTESEDVANNYAEQNEILLDQLRKGSKESWLLRKQDNELAQPDLPMDEWVEREALKSYKNLTGLDYSKNGKVESRMINPTKVLDISELGEVTNIDDFYKLLARETGVNEQILDDILELGDNVDDWNGVRAYQFLRNEGNGRAGRKVYDFLKELGYDAVRYAEDGTNHWALFDEPQNNVMAEDTGLNEKPTFKQIPSIDDGSNTIEVDVSELEDRRNGATYSADTATNTLRNSEVFNQNKKTRQMIEDMIKDGTADVDRQTWLAANTEAIDNLESKGFDGVKEDIMKSGTETTQTQVAESVFIVDNEIQKALESGDTSEIQRFTRRLVERMHKVGQALQALRMYGNTAAGMVTATDTIIGDNIKAYMNDADKNKNGKKAKNLKQNTKLANALKQLGYDGSMDVDKAPKTYEQILQEVKNTIGREMGSVDNRFSDTDVEYLAKLIEHGATTEELKSALNQHLVTGYFGMSAEDLQKITDLYKQADRAESSKDKAELRKQAAAIAAKYLGKPTFMDKWNSWRYLSMLGNPRTMIRNILGNTTFGAVTDVKDAVGAVLERALLKEGQRTKAILNPVTDKALIDACANDFDTVSYEAATEGGHKYNMKSDVEDSRQIFKSKLLEKARNLTNNVLEKSDVFALKQKYKKALAGYLKANGYDASVLKTDNAVLDKARAYAVEQAKEATFHADNKFADMLSDWSRSARERGGISGKIGEVLIESTMPFKKTPANILKQGFEYSPLGMFKLIGQINSQAGANEYINTISKALTGSAILALGAWLTSRGLLVGQRDDDDDPFNKGANYALKVGDKTYTIDWTAPAAMPLFVGAELYEHFNPNESAEEAKGFFEALSSIAEPAVEMSMLEGLSNTLDAISNAKNNKASSTAANIIAGYASQSIPTLSGQIARTIDPYRRSTRTNASTSKNPITATLEKASEKIVNKIPGLSMTNQKYVDVWGEPQKNSGGNLLGRAFQNFISPGYLNDTALTERERALTELQKTYNGKGSLIPSLASSNKPDGTRMSNAEYEKFAQARGEELREAVDSALKFKNAKGVSTEDIQECIHDIENFANFMAEHKQFGREISNTYKKAYEAYQLNGYEGVMNYYLMNMNADADGNGSISQQELTDYLRGSNIPKSDRKKYFKIKFPKAKEIPRLR